jgi:hypothetical protein
MSLPYGSFSHNDKINTDKNGEYVVDFPGMINNVDTTFWSVLEEHIAPIDDTDHRTKADEDELISNPNMTKELTNGSD